MLTALYFNVVIVLGACVPLVQRYITDVNITKGWNVVNLLPQRILPLHPDATFTFYGTYSETPATDKGCK